MKIDVDPYLDRDVIHRLKQEKSGDVGFQAYWEKEVCSKLLEGGFDLFTNEEKEGTLDFLLKEYISVECTAPTLGKNSVDVYKSCETIGKAVLGEVDEDYILTRLASGISDKKNQFSKQSNSLVESPYILALNGSLLDGVLLEDFEKVFYAKNEVWSYDPVREDVVSSQVDKETAMKNIAQGNCEIPLGIFKKDEYCFISGVLCSIGNSNTCLLINSRAKHSLTNNFIVRLKMHSDVKIIFENR